MKYMIVNIPVEIPSGDLCFHPDMKVNFVKCDYIEMPFASNCDPVCHLNLGGVVYEENGTVKKCKRCQEITDAKDLKRRDG